MKYLTLFFILLLITSINAEVLTQSSNSFKVELIPHYYRNNSEISLLSLNQSFDSISLSLNVYSINQISSIQVVETNKQIFNTLQFNDYGSIFNTSKIVAYTDKINITNYSQGDILNFTIVLSARDTQGSIYYGIGNKSIQIGRIEINQPIEDSSNNYLFYLIVIVFILGFFYYLNKSKRY